MVLLPVFEVSLPQPVQHPLSDGDRDMMPIFTTFGGGKVPRPKNYSNPEIEISLILTRLSLPKVLMVKEADERRRQGEGRRRREEKVQRRNP